MIDRFKRRFDRFDRSHGGSGRAGDDDALSAKQAPSLDLGIGRRTAAVLGDDGVDAVFPHELNLTFEREGATVEHIFHVGKRKRRVDGIDAAHQIKMLRGDLGMVSALATRRQEDAARGGAECRDGRGYVGDGMPVVAGFRHPLGTDERDRGNATAFDCRRGIGGDTFGEGMSGIDQQVVACGHQEIGEALGATEATDTNGNGLRSRGLRAAGERQQDLEIVSPGEFGGKPARFARAAQDQNAGLVHV